MGRLATVAAVIAFGILSMGAESCSTSSDNGGSDTAKSSGGGSKPAKPSEPEFTVSQQNAIDAANSYLDLSAFSKKGLIEQLSSSAGDGYPRKDAAFAVRHLNVNWNKQAVKAAKSYLDTSSFSCQGMVEQLSSSAGDNYTAGQAQYGAEKVGLC